jgi:hypothetical protein
MIFAFAKLDDLSWGTKGLDDNAGGGNLYAAYKIKHVLTWIAVNIVFSYCVISILLMDKMRKIILCN